MVGPRGTGRAWGCSGVSLCCGVTASCGAATHHRATRAAGPQLATGQPCVLGYQHATGPPHTMGPPAKSPPWQSQPPGPPSPNPWAIVTHHPCPARGHGALGTQGQHPGVRGQTQQGQGGAVPRSNPYPHCVYPGCGGGRHGPPGPGAGAGLGNISSPRGGTHSPTPPDPCPGERQLAPSTRAGQAVGQGRGRMELWGWRGLWGRDGAGCGWRCRRVGWDRSGAGWC